MRTITIVADHGNVVSWFWRYACPKYPCFKGGFVSSALAFSYNSQNFTAFGQFPFPESSPPIAAAATEVGPVVERGPLNNTDIGSVAYGHTYTVFANKTEGALSCQAECDADADCSAWTCEYTIWVKTFRDLELHLYIEHRSRLWKRLIQIAHEHSAAWLNLF